MITTPNLDGRNLTIFRTSGQRRRDIDMDNTVELPQDFGFRVPEGIVRENDFTTTYIDGNRYEVRVRFEIIELEDC